MSRKTKHLRNKKTGKFQGSIGAGKELVPTAATYPPYRPNIQPQGTRRPKDPRDEGASYEDAKLAAQRKGISEGLSWFLAEHPSPAVRVRLAENVYTHPAILDYLALDPIVAVRAEVARNPNCPAQAVEELLLTSTSQILEALRGNEELRQRWEVWSAAGQPNLDLVSDFTFDGKNAAALGAVFEGTPMALGVEDENVESSTSSPIFSELANVPHPEHSISSGGLAEYLKARGETQYNAYGIPID